METVLAATDLLVGIVLPAYKTLSLLQNQTDVGSPLFKARILYWVLFTMLQSVAWCFPSAFAVLCLKSCLVCLLQFDSLLYALHSSVSQYWYPVYARLFLDSPQKTD